MSCSPPSSLSLYLGIHLSRENNVSDENKRDAKAVKMKTLLTSSILRDSSSHKIDDTHAINSFHSNDTFAINFSMPLQQISDENFMLITTYNILRIIYINFSIIYIFLGELNSK